MSKQIMGCGIKDGLTLWRREAFRLRGVARLACALVTLGYFLFTVSVCAQTPHRRSAGSSAKAAAPGAKTQGSAPKVKPRVYKAVDPCAVASPHASLLLGPGVLSVQAASTGGTYHDGGCGLFIVDISVPSDSSGPAGFFPSFRVESGAVDLILKDYDLSSTTNYAGGFAIPDKACPLYFQETRVFVKQPDASQFSLIKKVKAQGVWGSSIGKKTRCELVQEPGKWLLSYGLPFGFNPPQSGTRVYRVAVGVKLRAVWNEVWQQVRVQASHDADIK